MYKCQTKVKQLYFFKMESEVFIDLIKLKHSVELFIFDNYPKLIDKYSFYFDSQDNKDKFLVLYSEEEGWESKIEINNYVVIEDNEITIYTEEGFNEFFEIIEEVE